MADARYLNDCQGYKNRGAGAAPWDAPSQKALPHSNGVAFGATVSTARDVAYFLGGYNKDDGFLDSVSRIKPDGTWTSEASLKMNESKSHFCAVYDEVLVSSSFAGCRHTRGRSIIINKRGFRTLGVRGGCTRSAAGTLNTSSLFTASRNVSG